MDWRPERTDRRAWAFKGMMCERYLASRQGRSEVHAADALNNLKSERELTLLATDQSPVVCRFLHVLRPIVLLGQFLREGGIMSSVAGSGSRRVGSSRVSKQTQLYRWQCVSWREVCREAVPEMSGPHWADLMLQCTHLLKLTVLTHEDVNVKNNNWCCNGAALSHAAHELTGIQQVQGTELPGPLCQVRAHSGDLPIAPESLGAGPGRKNLYVRASFEVI